MHLMMKHIQQEMYFKLLFIVCLFVYASDSVKYLYYSCFEI